MKERNNTIDIAKSICMMVVVAIHSELFAIHDLAWTNFAVPMFFFISGFFYHPSDNIIAFIKKNSFNLLLPSIIWVIPVRLFFHTLHCIDGDPIDWLEFDIDNPFAGNGPAWFLLALFYVRTTKLLFDKFLSSQLLQLIIFLILGYIGMNKSFPFYIDEFFAALPFFFGGNLIYKYLDKLLKYNSLVIIGIIMYLFVLNHDLRFWLKLANGSYTPCYIVAYLCTLFVFIPIFKMSAIINKWNAGVLLSIKCFLSDFGQNTIGILLTHIPFCSITAIIAHRIFTKGGTEWHVLFVIAYVCILAITYNISLFLTKRVPFILGKK